MSREKSSLIAGHTFAEPSDFSTLKEVTGMAGQRVGRDVLRVRPDANHTMQISRYVAHVSILGKHVQDGLEVALIEGIGELLC